MGCSQSRTLQERAFGSFLGVALLFAAGSAVEPALSAEDNAGSPALEEIVVTAERRSQDLQKVAASIDVKQGKELAEQGRISTAQILEDVPNVTFQASRGADNPNGNITIRGVQSTQQTGGSPGPSATATYVDDVYQGIGGDYDLNRVEVLRGPQGTLYGRSATGGVVAFHTNDPVLGKFGTDLYGEYGTADLRNATVALNLPAGDTFAVRLVGHETERHGFGWNVPGVFLDTKEARLKALYQPSDALRIVVSGSTARIQNTTGGVNPTLSAPNTISYASVTAPSTPNAGEYYQLGVNASYDFGPANLTYVGATHNFYQQYGYTGTFGPPFNILKGYGGTPLDRFNTQELRLASRPDARLTWIVGMSYYANMYNSSNESDVLTAAQMGPGSPADTGPGVVGAELFSSGGRGTTKDYGVFTEETFAFTDALRLTGGVRYDKTQLDKTAFYVFNVNFNTFGNALGTCSNLVAGASGSALPCVYTPFASSSDFSNYTYKARLEYDLTASNLVYVMTSTGFLPGDAQISPHSIDPTTGTVTFVKLPFSQERLTSYELGSKNRLFSDHLQLNGDVFYYNYQGYQQAVSTGQGPGGAPQFVVAAVPVRMIGAELCKPTSEDRVTLSGGILNATITSYPNLPGTTISTQTALGLSRLPGIAPRTAALTYDHNFLLGNGSRLVPRVEARYTAGQYLTELTTASPNVQIPGGLPYDWQASYTLLNAGLNWNSPNNVYGASLYVRNLTDRVYKAAVAGRGNFTTGDTVTPGDPRTYGVSFNARF